MSVMRPRRDPAVAAGSAVAEGRDGGMRLRLGQCRQRGCRGVRCLSCGACAPAGSLQPTPCRGCPALQSPCLPTLAAATLPDMRQTSCQPACVSAQKPVPLRAAICPCARECREAARTNRVLQPRSARRARAKPSGWPPATRASAIIRLLASVACDQGPSGVTACADSGYWGRLTPPATTAEKPRRPWSRRVPRIPARPTACAE